MGWAIMLTPNSKIGKQTMTKLWNDKETAYYNGMAQHVMDWAELDAWRDAMNYDAEYYDPSDVTQFENEYMLRLKMDGYYSDIKFEVFPTHKGSNIHKVWLYVDDKPIHNFTGNKGECLSFVKELIDAK